MIMLSNSRTLYCSTRRVNHFVGRWSIQLDSSVRKKRMTNPLTTQNIECIGSQEFKFFFLQKEEVKLDRIQNNRDKNAKEKIYSVWYSIPNRN
jgi:hypothetical protein